MTPVGLMVGAGVGSWLVVAALVDAPTSVAVFLGMLAPLAVTVGTWVAIERVHRRNPADVTRLMMAAFAGKMVFFGAYVAVVLRGLSVRPQPFVISFTAYFIGLYLIEALYLRRLFMGVKEDGQRRDR
jgi:hypothetical protein